MNSAVVQDSEEGDFQAGDQVGGGAGREADPPPGGEDSGHRQARAGGHAPHGRYLHRQKDSQEIVNHPGRRLMPFVNFSELLDTAPGFHFLYRDGRRGVYYLANP